MWRVRSFFQALHPIGMAYIEGNHRTVLAYKLLYGQQVDAYFPLNIEFLVKLPDTKQPALPLTKQGKIEKSILPTKSPLYSRSYDIKILATKIHWENLYEKPASHKQPLTGMWTEKW